MTQSVAGHVLIVEPNDITRKLLTGILAKHNYGAHEARTGAEAHDLLQHDFHIALVDVENSDPDLSGFLQKMQAEKSRLLIVAMADDSDDKAVSERLNLERVSVLQKPVMPDRLMKIVEAHAQAQMPSQPQAQVQAQVSAPEEVRDTRPGASAKYAEKDPAVLKQREAFMLRAIDLAQEKMDEGCGGPFGAVVVKGGKIISEGWNAVYSTHDPTAHAEIMALRHAGAALKTQDLGGCEVYTSCEPCPMCLAALYWAKVDRVFYACTRDDAEKIGFEDDFIYREISQPEHKRSISARMFMREDAKVVFDNWMKKEKAS